MSKHLQILGELGTAVSGKSAYEIALDNGFEGTEAEWLESLKGEDGKSAFQSAVESGFEGTEEEWVTSLHGKDGTDGTDGTDGDDGYTPIKGTDYWTDADKEEMVAEVIEATDPTTIELTTINALTPYLVCELPEEAKHKVVIQAHIPAAGSLTYRFKINTRENDDHATGTVTMNALFNGGSYTWEERIAKIDFTENTVVMISHSKAMFPEGDGEQIVNWEAKVAALALKIGDTLVPTIVNGVVTALTVETPENAGDTIADTNGDGVISWEDEQQILENGNYVFSNAYGYAFDIANSTVANSSNALVTSYDGVINGGARWSAVVVFSVGADGKYTVVENIGIANNAVAGFMHQSLTKGKEWFPEEGKIADWAGERVFASDASLSYFNTDKTALNNVCLEPRNRSEGDVLPLGTTLSVTYW